MVKIFSVIVNGVVFKDNMVLISQRSFEEPHQPGKWTIPGGKVEIEEGEEVFDIIEKTVKREVKEETGVDIEDRVELVTNNTFVRSNGQAVLALVFSCTYTSGTAEPLEDTIACKWATKEEVESMEFPPNVKEYILKAFSSRG